MSQKLPNYRLKSRERNKDACNILLVLSQVYNPGELYFESKNIKPQFSKNKMIFKRHQWDSITEIKKVNIKESLVRLGVKLEEYKEGESKIDTKSLKRVKITGRKEDITKDIECVVRTDSLHQKFIVDSLHDIQKRAEDLRVIAEYDKVRAEIEDERKIELEPQENSRKRTSPESKTEQSVSVKRQKKLKIPRMEVQACHCNRQVFEPFVTCKFLK